MTKTKIPWADYSWGVLTGCSHSGSPGCDHCYASAMARRFHRPWGSATFHPEKLDEPRHVKKPSRIFVASTSDPWHESVTDSERQKILFVALNETRHTFIMLTKRPENIDPATRFPPNVWVGVSAENQEQYRIRWNELCRRVRAKVRFVSVEPMLGPVRIFGHPPDWVICGSENGAGKRPCDQQWIADLASECHFYGPSFFDKSSPFIRREYPQGRSWKTDKRDEPNIRREYPK